jgi:hypothetical protein
MATMVYTDAFVSINSVDLSDHVKSVTLTYEAEVLDDTVMGTSGTRSAKPGLKNWTLEVNFLQDYAAASVDATLFPLVGAAAFPIKVRPVKGSAISSTNPEYQGNAILTSYPPLTGEVGALSMATASMRAGGGSALVRDITP